MTFKNDPWYSVLSNANVMGLTSRLIAPLWRCKSTTVWWVSNHLSWWWLAQEDCTPPVSLECTQLMGTTLCDNHPIISNYCHRTTVRNTYIHVEWGLLNHIQAVNDLKSALINFWWQVYSMLVVFVWFEQVISIMVEVWQRGLSYGVWGM